MAKSYLVPINMGGLEIQSMLVHNLAKASEPTGAEGQIYTDTTNHVLMFHDNNAGAAGWNRVWDDRDVAQNSVLAGPVSGGAGASTFRALGTADIPDLSGTYAPLSHDFDSHSGDLDLGDIGSYQIGGIIIGGASDWEVLPPGTQAYVLTMGSSNTISWQPPGSPSAHDLLGSSHDTVPHDPVLGDLIKGNASDQWTYLSIGDTSDILAVVGGDATWQSRAELDLAYHDGTPTTNAIPQWSSTEGLLTDGLALRTTMRSVAGGADDISLLTEQAVAEAVEAIAISALEDIGDVAAYSSIAAGELLEWSGTAWVHQTVTELGLAEYSGTPTDEYIPKFTGTRGQIENGYSIQTTITDTDASIPTSGAVVDYVATALSGGVTYIGGYDVAANSPALEGTPTVSQGSMYTCTTGGDFYGQTLEVGDVLIAENDDPTTLAEWTIVSAEVADAFVVLQDTPSSYTGSGGYMVMVNSTPDALEFVNPATYALSNFNDDLSYENQLTFGIGLTRTVDTVDLDLNDLSTVTTLQGVDLFAIYDNSVSGTRNISYTNVLAQIEADLDSADYTKKIAVDCDAATFTVVNTTAIGDKDVAVHVYRVASPYDQVECDVEHTSPTSVTVRFAVAPSLGEYRIVIIG